MEITVEEGWTCLAAGGNAQGALGVIGEPDKR